MSCPPAADLSFETKIRGLVALCRPPVWPVILTVSLYGGVIKLILPVFGREASWGDLVADVPGALCGGFPGALCGKICRRPGIIG